MASRIVRNASIAILLVGAAGCKKPDDDAPWKQALSENKVIWLQKKPTADAKAKPAGRPPALQADKFDVPPSPLLDSTPALEPSIDLPPVVPPSEATRPVDHEVRKPNQSAARPTKDLQAVAHECQRQFERVVAYQTDLVLEEQNANHELVTQTIRVRAHRATGRRLLEWLDTNWQGRRVAFDAKAPNRPVTVWLGPKEPPLQGKSLVLPADHPMIHGESRQPLERLLLDAWVDGLLALTAEEAQPRPMRRLSLLDCEPFPGQPGRSATHLLETRPGSAPDPLFLFGGRRDWYVDAELKLPTLIVSVDAHGHTLERFAFTKVDLNPRFSPSDLVLE